MIVAPHDHWAIVDPSAMAGHLSSGKVVYLHRYL